MSETYTRDHLKIFIAKILTTLDWTCTNSTPLELLTDLLAEYIERITRTTINYANHLGYSQANLDHLAMAFHEMSIDITELAEYKQLDFFPKPELVPSYPLPKADNLNFLKPGSNEVVIRPVHIPVHLPPMPGTSKTEVQIAAGKCAGKRNISSVDSEPMSSTKKKKITSGNPEISSVFMTTSGFLSPARQGKLPTPHVRNCSVKKDRQLMKTLKKQNLKSRLEGIEPKKKGGLVKLVFTSKQVGETPHTVTSAGFEDMEESQINEQVDKADALKPDLFDTAIVTNLGYKGKEICSKSRKKN